MADEQELLSGKEKLACSLISRYSYKEVKDVIDEACLHQRDKLKALGYKSPEEVTMFLSLIAEDTLKKARVGYVKRDKEKVPNG